MVGVLNQSFQRAVQAMYTPQVGLPRLAQGAVHWSKARVALRPRLAQVLVTRDAYVTARTNANPARSGATSIRLGFARRVIAVLTTSCAQRQTPSIVGSAEVCNGNAGYKNG